MNSLKSVLWWLLGGGLALAFGALYGAQHWYTQPVAGLSEQTVLVTAGSTYSDVINRWRRSEQIELPRLWRLAGRLTGSASRIQAGEYQLPRDVTPQQTLQRLSRGEGLVSYKVAFIEGWTLNQARQALAAQTHLRHTLAGVPNNELLTMIDRNPVEEGGLAKEPIDAKEAFESSLNTAEGWFFPDTYAYHRGASDKDILQRAYDRMQRVLTQSWEQRAQGLTLRSPYEALVLASIVEKETGRGSDRATISQVFNRRLQLGMKLQTDPTVIYGVGDAFAGDLTRKHLQTDTPYNSYTRFGLPPTPIALPGRDSIVAALNPAEGEYLYFVARGDGTSQFSETLAEHNAAVRRYQLNR